jgi:hypothetical protein
MFVILLGEEGMIVRVRGPRVRRYARRAGPVVSGWVNTGDATLE